MNLLAMLPDPAAKDTRAASGKGLPGRAGSDPQAVPFPEILDDVGVEMIQAAPFRAVPEAKPPAGGPTRVASASAPDAGAVFDALVASAASEPVAAPEVAPEDLAHGGKGSGDAAIGEATVDHLLKRVAKAPEDDLGTAATTPAQPVPAAPLVPMAPPTLGMAAATPSASDASEPKRAIAAGEPKRDAQELPTPAKTISAPRLSDVAVATQFAPALQAAGGKPATGKAKPAADPTSPVAREAPRLPYGAGALPPPTTVGPPEAVSEARTSAAPDTPKGRAEDRIAVDHADSSPAREADAPPPVADAAAAPEPAPVQLGTVPAPPATGLGSARQVAAGIVQLASQAAAVPSAEPVTPRTIARTLTLKMSPAELGTVAIKMHMSGTTLDVQLTMSDPRTTGLVERERDTLTTAIADKGYELHSLIIQDGGAVALPGVHHASQGDTFGGQSQTSQRGDEHGARQDGQPRREQAGQQPQRESSGGTRGRAREAVPDPRRGAFVV